MAASMAAGRRLACGSSCRRPPALSRQPLARGRPLARAATAVDIGTDSYCCLGLAHCFRKNEDGKLEDVFVIEPLSASSLECMATGARTSFKLASGIRLGDALRRDRSLLPEGFGGGVWCDAFDDRLTAAARTWLRPHAQDNLMDIVPLGKVRSNWNFSLDDKRVLNMVNEVTDADNIKQDISIDVYGRAEQLEKEKEREAAASAATAAAAAACAAAQAALEEEEEEEEEDALDTLLAG